MCLIYAYIILIYVASLWLSNIITYSKGIGVTTFRVYLGRFVNLRVASTRKPVEKLSVGEVGYVCANIKSVSWPNQVHGVVVNRWDFYLALWKEKRDSFAEVIFKW